MAKKIINNGDTGALVRAAINDNFTELYNENTTPTHTHAAGNITFTPAGGLVSTNTQAAIEEINSNINTTSADNVTVTPAGSITSIDVQSALEELDTDITGLTGTNIAFTPTGTIVATDVQAAIAEVSGDVTVLQVGHDLILTGASTALNQLPTATDTPLQVEFGALQSTTDVGLAADGTITFNTTGKYMIVFNAHYGRTTATGTSELLGRFVENGTTQIGNTLHAKIDDASTSAPWESSFIHNATATDTLTVEIMRDSTGDNSGGLYLFNPTLAGWGDAPSASITIYKVT